MLTGRAAEAVPGVVLDQGAQRNGFPEFGDAQSFEKRRGAVATLRIGILFTLLKAGEFFAYPIAGANFLRKVEYAQQLPRVRFSSARTLEVRGGEELPEWHADQGKNFHVAAFDAREVTASRVP